MKNVWLMGGFGNTLFQILTFRIIKKTTNDIKYTTVLTEENILTSLIKWKVHQAVYGDLISEKDCNNISLIDSFFIVTIAHLSKLLNKRFDIATFYSDNIKLTSPYSNNIFGYFQEKYFLLKYKDDLFCLGNDLRNLYGNNSNKIVVHYRKGDSGWAKKYLNYYNKVRALVQNETEEVIVVTDSEKDAKDFFSECLNVSVICSKDAMDDFRYMVSSKKLYCAPSTFSWWAAHSLKDEADIVMPNLFNDILGIYVNKERLTVVECNG